MKRIITISREFGSGGRTIGKEVAARLNIPSLDSGVLKKVLSSSRGCIDFFLYIT